jgi:cytochrome b561
MAEAARYSPLQKGLHWTTAVAVILMVPLGFYMVQRYFATDNDALTVRLFDVHKLIGFLLLWLVIVRVAVRLRSGTPPHPPSLAPVQRIAAEAVHGMLYLLLIIVPLLGWAGASAYGLLSLPGGLRLPPILAENTDLAGRILWWHAWGAIALALLAAAHIGAALMHRFLFKDGIFERMWPDRGKQGS